MVRCSLAKFILSFLLLAATASTSLAQAWRGIKPMESTCRDVEQALGGKACGEYYVERKVPIGLMYVYFENGTCKNKRYRAKYDVASGTAIALTIFIHPPHRLSISDLGLDVSKLKRVEAGHQLSVVKYVSEELGVYINATKEGPVTSIVYGAPAIYDRLLCVPKPAPNNGMHPTRLSAGVIRKN